MARSLNDIQQNILDTRAAAPELSALEVLTDQEQSVTAANSSSKVANWRLWVFIFSKSTLLLEQLWDAFRDEIEARIAATRVHNQKWYRQKGLDYQHGFELGESDVYDNTGYTDDQVKASRIIANAAVQRLQQNGYGIVRIKVVRKVNNELAPLTGEQLTGFRAYMNLVSDAGTTIVATTAEADLLKVKMDVYYDPTILSPTGAMLDGSDDNPLRNGIEAFTKSQEFNGRLVRRFLENHTANIRGVVVPKIVGMWSKYGDYSYETTGIQNVGVIDEIRTPDAGYLKLDILEVNWIAEE